MDRKLYDLQMARAFLRAAALLLSYASTYLHNTDDRLWEELGRIRSVVEELLYRVESKLASYLELTPGEEHSMVSSARKIVEEVVLGNG